MVFTAEESRLRLAIANHRGATEGFTEGGLSAASYSPQRNLACGSPTAHDLSPQSCHGGFHRGITEGARRRLVVFHHRGATEGFTEEARRGLAGGTWFFTTELPRRVSQRKHGGGLACGVVFTTEESRRRLVVFHHRGATEGFTEEARRGARRRCGVHHGGATKGFTEEARRGECRHRSRSNYISYAQP